MVEIKWSVKCNPSGYITSRHYAKDCTEIDVLAGNSLSCEVGDWRIWLPPEKRERAYKLYDMEQTLLDNIEDWEGDIFPIMTILTKKRMGRDRVS